MRTDNELRKRKTYDLILDTLIILGLRRIGELLLRLLYRLVEALHVVHAFLLSLLEVVNLALQLFGFLLLS